MEVSVVTVLHLHPIHVHDGYHVTGTSAESNVAHLHVNGAVLKADLLMKGMLHGELIASYSEVIFVFLAMICEHRAVGAPLGDDTEQCVTHYNNLRLIASLHPASVFQHPEEGVGL